MVVMGVLVVAGCVSHPYVFQAERAERFISRTPDLPTPRVEALRAGRVVPGMTEKEVSICFGRPQERSRIERDGQSLVAWHYLRVDRTRGELERSGMWHRPVPLARVYFGPDGTVVSVRVFSQSAPEGRAQASVTPPPAVGVRPAGARQDEAASGGSPSVSAPVDTGTTDEGRFEGWPNLALNGVILGAGEPCAIVNRRVVAQGETVEGVTVREITARGVMLQRGDSIRFLQTGQATQP